MSDSNYKITIQYDGSRYHGWQAQNHESETVQGKIATVLERLYGYPIDVIGSGRTDAGVHAIGQVANFHLRDEVSEQEILQTVNKYLPEDIAVIAVEKVDGRFHARYSAVAKTYRYRISIGDYSNVFERKYLYYYKDASLDVSKMREATKYLIGEHDFKSFCANKHMKKSTVRTITDISIIEDNNEIVIEYSGNGFLQNMIRILTGTLIEVGNGSRSAEDVKRVIDSRDREQAGYTAPACGLTLVKVIYD